MSGTYLTIPSIEELWMWLGITVKDERKGVGTGFSFMKGIMVNEEGNYLYAENKI